MATTPPAVEQNPLSSTARDTRPSVLIIGGLGYIGRHLATYIHTNKLASTLRVVDKQLPALAHLASEHLAACSGPNFVQADASRPPSLPSILTPPSTSPGTGYDYIFNCGGPPRHATPSAESEDLFFSTRAHDLSLNLAREVCRRGTCKAYIELGTGFVYPAPQRGSSGLFTSSSSPPVPPTPASENLPRAKLKPATKRARWALRTEDALLALAEPAPNSPKPSGKQGSACNTSTVPQVDTPAAAPLPLVILRLAHVYGPYTQGWLGTQLALARVYADLGAELKFLWGPELRTHTVHVEDVARACWAAAEWRADTTIPSADRGATTSAARMDSPVPGQTSSGPGQGGVFFNVVDQGDTSQRTIAGLLGSAPLVDGSGVPGSDAASQLKTGFQSTLINTFARVNLDRVVDELNDETLDVWAELCEDAAAAGQRGGGNGLPAGDAQAMQPKAVGLSAGGSTPLSPFVDREMLGNADLCLDGKRFCETTGFKYDHPRLDDGEMASVIESYKRMGWWP